MTCSCMHRNPHTTANKHTNTWTFWPCAHQHMLYPCLPERAVIYHLCEYTTGCSYTYLISLNIHCRAREFIHQCLMVAKREMVTRRLCIWYGCHCCILSLQCFSNRFQPGNDFIKFVYFVISKCIISFARQFIWSVFQYNLAKQLVITLKEISSLYKWIQPL